MARKLPRIYEFDPGIHIQQVVLAGCGGTGAQIGRMLARLVYDMRQKDLQTPHLIFVDPDRVEHGNIGRQLFTAGDVEQNKAEVLARRFNVALGLRIEARPRRVMPEDLNHGRGGYFGTPGTLLVGAVDNAAARAVMHKHVQGVAAWIDCGNHEHGGQVAIGNRTEAWYADRFRWNGGKYVAQRSMTYLPNGEGQYTTLPAPTMLFPDLLTPEPEGLSCAQMVERNRQALFVNDAMAVAAMNYVHKLLLREPVRSFVTYVDTVTNNVRSVPLTRENLRRHIQQRSISP